MKSKLIEELEKKISKELQDKWFNNFSQQSFYLGNGVYSNGNRYSTDTRELFLMHCADREGISFKNY